MRDEPFATHASRCLYAALGIFWALETPNDKCTVGLARYPWRISGTRYRGHSQDQTSSRANTLFDDADDIQRQLDNEARDRIKFGRPKTIWVFHFPTHFPDHNSVVRPPEEQARRPRQIGHTVQDTNEQKSEPGEEEGEEPKPPSPPTDWNYPSQGEWSKTFPLCGGKSQSPVDLPVAGLIKPRGGRRLLFQNNDVPAKSMTLMNDGKQMILYGEWKPEQRPLIYGGAAHSRRYLFHSLIVHLPAEHTVGLLYYPLETQAYYVSAEYVDMNQALTKAPSDPQAILAIANLYSYGNHTHQGLMDILTVAKKQQLRNSTIDSHCLNYFHPPFKEYACYQGSLTHPPCTESVLWLIRGRTLYIKRDTWEIAKSLMSESAESKQINFRMTQPMNDRKVYYFKG